MPTRGWPRDGRGDIAMRRLNGHSRCGASAWHRRALSIPRTGNRRLIQPLQFPGTGNCAAETEPQKHPRRVTETVPPQIRIRKAREQRGFCVSLLKVKNSRLSGGADVSIVFSFLPGQVAGPGLIAFPSQAAGLPSGFELIVFNAGATSLALSYRASGSLPAPEASGHSRVSVGGDDGCPYHAQARDDSPQN
jgi:hypothetical protein